MKTAISFLSCTIVCNILCLYGCTKATTGTPSNHDEIMSVKITGAAAVYYAGDTISLSTSSMPYANFSWRQQGSATVISHQPNLVIYGGTKYNEGWYYVTVSDLAYATHTDSVYIKVINRPAVAPCNSANNVVSFSAIPDIKFSTATWGISPAWNCMHLKGYRAVNYPDINIYFHPYWNNHEPEDGAYQAASDTSGFQGANVYTVYIQSAYEGVYFGAGAGKVYVSHSGNKLQVSFCGLPMTGNFDGAMYTMTATGKLTAP